jgi:3-hydroxyisobutyrate dehydrogenase-like beta-hydroxyacid dehydrogenase
MTATVALIGFGEAGQALAKTGMRVFDILTEDPGARAAKLADYRRAHVQGCDTARDALAGATVILSLVSADQARAAAEDNALLVGPSAIWFDMNSVAAETKRAGAAAIEHAGGRYVDVAIMAPVRPQRFDVPLLVAGPDAEEGAEVLRGIGFTNVRVAGRRIGDAAAIKMIRSVMIKGIEALSAECILAATHAGVEQAVLASLDASWDEQGWADRVDYGLDRMLAHGLRRAAEMEEAAKTLAQLGVEPVMTRGTIRRQRAMGMLGIDPPVGLVEKLAAIGAAAKGEVACR